MANHDPFDFSRFLGSNMGFGMPGIVTPTLDVDELDKKIKDLKAVEGWLSMNLSMLQMSIQGLEVQRNTLSSLKAMGEAFNQSMSDVSKAAKESAAASAAAREPVTPQEPVAEAAPPSGETPAGMWPWEIAAKAMANLQQQMQANAEQVAANASTDQAPANTATEQATAAKKAASPRKTRTASSTATKKD